MGVEVGPPGSIHVMVSSAKRVSNHAGWSCVLRHGPAGLLRMTWSGATPRRPS